MYSFFVFFVFQPYFGVFFSAHVPTSNNPNTPKYIKEYVRIHESGAFQVDVRNPVGIHVNAGVNTLKYACTCILPEHAANRNYS